MEIGRKLKIRKYGTIVMVMGESLVFGTPIPVLIFFLALREQEGEVSAIRRAHVQEIT